MSDTNKVTTVEEAEAFFAVEGNTSCIAVNVAGEEKEVSSLDEAVAFIGSGEKAE